MLTQSTQLGCSCAWALASTQTHKLVCPCRSHTSDTVRARGCAPSNPATRGIPPSCTSPCVSFSAGARRSHTSDTVRARGCASSNPAARGDTPPRAPTHVYVLAQGARRTPVDFFHQSLLYISGDFHTFGPFPERIVLFKLVEPFMMPKGVIRH